jgi:hypothetical protein
MKITQAAGIIGIAVLTVSPGISGSKPDLTGVPTKMVITVRPAPGNQTQGDQAQGNQAKTLQPGDLTVLRGNTPIPVLSLQRLTGDLADMQLFVLMDDSTRSSSLSLQFPELKAFLAGLPASTQVAMGYMRNGSFGLAQAFTADHQKAVGALRLPMAIPGENGSPYFALSDLAKHWPSKEPTGRRAVLMLTDGVDRYWGAASMHDPYVDTAVHDALKAGVMVYSIYLRGAGLEGRSGWATTTAQSRLIEVSEETGGCAYFQGFTDPVTISPFLSDFQDRLANQYQVTIEGANEKGVQPVKLRVELPGLKILAPTHIYVR